MTSIDLENVSKNFGPFPAVFDVSLRIEPGEFVAFLGPSGSGKTTLLRMIAGLDYPDNGEIRIGEQDMSNVSARKRGVGFVFQHYALFRHMTVRDNIAFGLRVRRWRLRPSRREIRSRVEKLLSLVQLDGHGRRYPAQLSGGQRQRVALARALAVEPRVLLLDEPFGALDAQVRKDLRRWLRSLHDETKLTSVFVTHDQEEALELADRIVVLRAGRIEQIGTPQLLYDRPASPFIMEFMGRTNRFAGMLRDGALMIEQQKVACGDIVGHAADSAVIYVRPHDFSVSRDAAPDHLAARIDLAVPLAMTLRLECRLKPSNTVIEIELPRRTADEQGIQPGQTIWVRPEKAFIFPAR